MPERRKWGVCHFCTKSVAMATSLEISKKTGPDRLSTTKKLTFDVKIAKIGPADLQIICLREIIKKRKKLRTVKYIALSAIFAERAKEQYQRIHDRHFIFLFLFSLNTIHTVQIH